MRNCVIIPPFMTEVSTPSKAFLSYPVSTLSPPITPTDLSTFKTRGISEVERDLQQKLRELREQYVSAIDHFNWNKLVYEAIIQFEPVVGETYHLYEVNNRNTLSMIAPHEWSHHHLATIRLNVDRQWKVEELGKDVNSEKLFGNHPS
jgi:Protein of unknown function (DUF2452)